MSMKKLILSFATGLMLYSCDYQPNGENTKNNTNTGVENLEKTDKDSSSGGELKETQREK
jgi:hypothetical protein